MEKQIIKCAAVSYVERFDGRILVVWNKRYGGWGLPGGLVEDGETIDEALRRELQEETSLEINSYEPMWIMPASLDQQNTDRASIIHLFRITKTSGMAQETELGCPVTWFTREEFLKWSPFATLYEPCFASLFKLRE